MSEINRPRIALRVLAHGLAAAWPFIGTYYEYTSLNASGAMSDVCDESGTSTTFPERADLLRQFGAVPVEGRGYGALQGEQPAFGGEGVGAVAEAA